MDRSSWFTFALLCLTPLSGFAAPSTFSERLTEADRVRSSDPQRFGILLDELEATRKAGERSQAQQLQFLRAYQNLVYRNRPDEGIAQAKLVFQEAVEPDLRFRAGTLLTNTLGTMRDFSEGLRVLNQTLPLSDQVENKEWRDIGLNSAALFYNALGQHTLALQYANEVLDGGPSDEVRCVAGISVIEAKFRLGTLPADDAFIEEKITQCLAIGNEMAANYDRLALARKWSDQGQGDKAIELLERHTGEVDAVGFHGLKAEFHALLAKLKLEKGNLAGAETHAKAAVSAADPLDGLLALATANHVLFQIANRRGQPHEALAYFQRYAQAEKAHLNDVKVRELAYETVRNETLHSSHKIQLLSRQNEVLRLQQRVQKQANQNLGLVVLLLGLIATGVGFWAYKVKRLHLSLRHFAETDALTGISNRHHFTQQCERSLAQCEAAGESAALIMFDLDRFKSINDTYGHDSGDWVLERVAASCAGLCRRIDRFGRLGGEEFAILLHGCELNAAVRLAEDCRIRLSQIDTTGCGHTFQVTASFGVSSTALSGHSLNSLMTHADLMLYRAKREGRNLVRAHRGDVPAASARSGSVVPLERAAGIQAAPEPVTVRFLERRTS